MKKTEFLKNVYFFSKLTDAEILKVAVITKEIVLPGEKQIFKEGDKGDALYVVLKGEVRISTMIPGVGEEALAVLKSGDYFGEMALIDDAPRSADAITNGDVTLLRMDKEDFNNLVFKNKELAYKLLWVFVKTLSSRLRETNERLKTILSIAKSF